MLPCGGIAHGAAALQSTGYNGRPPLKPLSPAAQNEEQAVQGSMLSLAGQGPHVRNTISQVVHDLQARGLKVLHPISRDGDPAPPPPPQNPPLTLKQSTSRCGLCSTQIYTKRRAHVCYVLQDVRFLVRASQRALHSMRSSTMSR